MRSARTDRGVGSKREARVVSVKKGSARERGVRARERSARTERETEMRRERQRSARTEREDDLIQ